MKENRINQLRKMLNLTQRDFGKRIFLSQNQVSSIEKGHRNATDRVLSDICKEFNVNIDWLKNGFEPIFNDVLEDLPITDEAKELAKIYSTLNTEQQNIIKSMINALTKKEDGTERQPVEYHLELESAQKEETSLSSNLLSREENKTS